MIKKQIRETLSNEELWRLARSFATVIKIGQGVPGMEKEVAAAEKSFISLMKDLPEHTTRSGGMYYNAGSVWYTEFRKVLGTNNNVSWYSSGQIVIDDLIRSSDCIFIQPWEPQDPEAKKRRDTADNQYELDFMKEMTGVNIEERMERERIANVNSYKSDLNRFNMALVKFQRQKLFGEKIRPLKRFMVKGRKFYEYMDTLITSIEMASKENCTDENKSIVLRAIKIAEEELKNVCLAIEQLFNHRVYIKTGDNRSDVTGFDFALNSFKNEELARISNKRGSLYWHMNDTDRGYYQNFSSIEEIGSRRSELEIQLSIELSTLFPKVYEMFGSHYTRNTVEKCICYYHLIKLLANTYDEHGAPRVWMFKDFCETMGLIAPEPKDEEEANGEEHS